MTSHPIAHTSVRAEFSPQLKTSVVVWSSGARCLRIVTAIQEVHLDVRKIVISTMIEFDLLILLWNPAFEK